MIHITKKEAFKMRELGYGYAVKKTYSGHKKYFLVEEPDRYRFNPETEEDEIVKVGALSILKDLRESIKLHGSW